MIIKKVLILTTINKGYGDLHPETSIGKVFTMIILIIGLPLTSILIMNLSSLLTRYVKFYSILVYTLYEEGYIKKVLYKMKSFNKIRKLKNNDSKSIKNGENHRLTNDDDDDEEISMNSFLIQAIDCMGQSDDTFDFKLSFMIFLLFIYLTMGALVSSHLAQWCLIDGYYFIVITLTTIGLGDKVIREETNNFNFIIRVVIYAYTLFGLAFFASIVQCLHSRLRLYLLDYGQVIVTHLSNFLKQFGINWNLEEMVYNQNYSQTSFTSSDIGDEEEERIANFYPHRSNTNSFSHRLNSTEYNNHYHSHQNYLSSKLYNTMSNNNNINNKKRHSRTTNYDNHIESVVMRDKQTQITTLLCSTYKREPKINNNSIVTPSKDDDKSNDNNNNQLNIEIKDIDKMPDQLPSESNLINRRSRLNF
jgi:hypothetical protein